MAVIPRFVIFEEKFIYMDLSDILPLLIIVGGALISLVGKSSKKESAKGATAMPRPGAATPTLPPDAKPKPDLIDDWIPTNDNLPPQPATKAKKRRGKRPQPWELEGGRVITTANATGKAAEGGAREQLSPTGGVQAPQAGSDPNYAPVSEDADEAAMPQDWRKAVIAYEILKTKF